MIYLLLSLLSPAVAADYSAAVGGQVDAEGHGVLNLELRQPTWRAALYTDTLDARWTPSSDRGKGWLGVRLVGAAAGLMISPWTDGRPDPQRAFYSRYVGLEYGLQRYARGGIYFGAEGNTRQYAFAPLSATAVSTPPARLVSRLDAVLGWYRRQASAKLTPGVDLVSVGAAVQPHVVFDGQVDPGWVLSPLVEVRAGWAQGQDDVTLTRLGGLNPYVVPMAGAAWAEWWVQDYAALRVGPDVQLGQVSAALLSDLAAFDRQVAAGFSAHSRVSAGKVFGQLEVGYAPWIDRPDDHSRVSVWFAVGADWGGDG